MPVCRCINIYTNTHTHTHTCVRAHTHIHTHTHTHTRVDLNSAWRMWCWPKLGRRRPVKTYCCDFDPSCPWTKYAQGKICANTQWFDGDYHKWVIDELGILRSAILCFFWWVNMAVFIFTNSLYFFDPSPPSWTGTCPRSRRFEVCRRAIPCVWHGWSGWTKCGIPVWT